MIRQPHRQVMRLPGKTRPNCPKLADWASAPTREHQLPDKGLIYSWPIADDVNVRIAYSGPRKRPASSGRGLTRRELSGMQFHEVAHIHRRLARELE